MSGTKVAKRGKENAPPKTDPAIDDAGSSTSFGKDTAADSSFRRVFETESKQASQILERRWQRRTGWTRGPERDRLKKERDAFAKQLEELSRLRQTEQEIIFERYKKEADERAKLQAEMIETATALDEKRVSKISELEKLVKEQREALGKAHDRLEAAAAAPSLDSKIDGKGVKDLREEVYKLRKVVKERDEQVDLEAEIQHTQQLQEAASKAPAPAAPPPAEDSEKDALSLGLYEDLSGLAILGVSVKKTQKGRDVTFKCMQTYEDRTLAFKLRSFNEFDREANKWVKNVALIPENLHNETDKAFVKRLGPFAKGFCISRDQLPAAWEQLRSRMSREGQYRDPEQR
ncbi:hypothetical protein A1Q2_05177 [Trichosporon asahii var. asahii CBS 8904]|uniref:Monopolin complex subunit Csm1/Pcs1 C-terminal domain-containing protein n=1 Tax=Trichosporon asahii var. asahii (strain CBS 8904) TaxID=1220162 RepID=K1VMB5_TRIAC|nr:hypothetical protein A1Q2_05177 [Trichosporon asahii var. asahii CBS 8904]